MILSKVPDCFRVIITVTAVFLISSCSRLPVVTIYTSMGDFDVIIYKDKAPVTAANFLSYVDSGFYKDCSFYRVVNLGNQPNDSIKIEVIQGGLRNSGHKAFAPIKHENTAVTGIKHEDGTISMARSAVGTASSEFFICIGDQPGLDYGGRRNPDGEGFAAFGKVITGMKVVRSIQALPSEKQYLPEPVRIFSIERK